MLSLLVLDQLRLAKQDSNSDAETLKNLRLRLRQCIKDIESGTPANELIDKSMSPDDFGEMSEAMNTMFKDTNPELGDKFKSILLGENGLLCAVMDGKLKESKEESIERFKETLLGENGLLSELPTFLDELIKSRAAEGEIESESSEDEITDDTFSVELDENDFESEDCDSDYDYESDSDEELQQIKDSISSLTKFNITLGVAVVFLTMVPSIKALIEWFTI